MKTTSTQQEILLVTGTRFSSKQWCKNDDTGKGENPTSHTLEEACWNGLLPDLLPEICSYPAGTGKLFIWDIRQTSSFLELDLGSFPGDKDHYFSIDPYSFMITKSDN